MFVVVLTKPLEALNFVVDKSLYGLLLEIDECSEPPGTFCDMNAYCIDTEFSYQCACKEGYTGDGFSGNCNEIGESLIKNWNDSIYYIRILTGKVLSLVKLTTVSQDIIDFIFFYRLPNFETN